MALQEPRLYTLTDLTNGTVSFTSSPPRTYMGDGFTHT